VRGRKKNAFEDLGQEVEYLRKENSHLQLVNAKLETENKSLKDQV
jgi:cell division protein FtsB